MTRHVPAATFAPRGLRRENAALYVGVSPSKFDELVHDGRMPKPKRVDGCVVWDRVSLDIAFDALPSEEEANPWDEL
jgi:predicted DNA-binding transcriptional regulator AlpA